VVTTDSNAGDDSGGSLLFKTKPEAGALTERMRIDASGNVGIGTSSPSAPLNVYNASNPYTKFEDAANYLNVGVITSNYGLINSSLPLSFQVNDTERMRIDASGNVKQNSVNTSTNVGYSVNNGTYDAIALGTGGFGVNGGAATDGGIRAYNNLLFGTGASATERMRIDASGNVGIGVVPSVWRSNEASIDIGRYSTSTSVGNYSNGGSLFAYNTFINTSGQFTRKATGFSTTYNTFNGVHEWTSDASAAVGAFTPTPRMTLDASGSLLVGTTDDSIWDNTTGNGINLRGDLGLIASARTNAEPLMINRMGTDGEIIKLNKDGTTVGSIGVDSGDNLYIGGSAASHSGLYFGTNTAAPITAGTLTDAVTDLGTAGYRFKDLYLSGGVYLGGTGAANKLEDYEEGTWTPTIVGSTTAGAFTYSVNQGTYTKVGDLVTVNSAIYVTATATSPVGNVSIYGLPFSISTQFPSFTVGWSQFITFADQLGAYGGGTQITLRNMLSGDSGSFVSGADFGSSFYLFISGSYHV
jgi:hypothetical protein